MKKIYFFTIFFLALLFLNIHITFSQFGYTGGPVGGGTICMAVSGQNVYAGTQTGGVSYTTDNGGTWLQINNGLTNLNVVSIAVSGNNIFAGTSSGIFRSTNNGTNWALMTYAGIGTVTAITIIGTDIWLGNSAAAVYKSTDNGSTWTLNPNIFNGAIGAILSANNYIYVATTGVFVSTNNGTNWSFQSVTFANIKSLYAIGSVVRAGAQSGGFKAATPLGSWEQELPWSNYILAFASAGSFVLEGGSTGIFWSSNNGTNWQDPNINFMSGAYILSMTQNSSYIFAGTSGGVAKRSISEITALTHESTIIPEKYSLNQNYPNPFNPSTTIKFAIPKSGSVLLRVYNELGQQVAELVNEKLDAGTYNYSFDASAYSSGVYYYKLISNDYTDTKKMVLVK